MILRNAKITGQIYINSACFDGALEADLLQVDGSLDMHNANFTHEVNMVFAHVGGSLNLSGATLADLNLSGSSIAGDLVLGEPGKSAV